LIRWYTLHVLFLPLAAIALMAMHFWRVRKDGGISTEIPYGDPEYDKDEYLADTDSNSPVAAD